jgi:drug/metabolite transporter (DMT)-like permease
MLRRFGILFVGVFACSTAVIMIKLSSDSLDSVLLASYRCVLAAIFLSPLFRRDLIKNRGRYTRTHLLRCVLPGLLLGIHFVTWIYGARMSLAANSSLIVNMVPLVMPFVLYAIMREHPTRGELAGSALAIAGVIVMTVADFTFSPEHFSGDILCLVSMVFFCVYLVLARRNRDFPTVWLYLVPVYTIAGVACFIVGVFVANPWQAYAPGDIAVMFGLTLVPTVIGHSTLNWAMRHLGAQTVGIANLGQVLFATIMAYFILRETPRGTTGIAAGLIACGIVVALRSAASSQVSTIAETQDD